MPRDVRRMSRGTGESAPDNGKVAGVLTEPANAYARRLNTWDAAMIVIGGVIGAGIFLTPSTVARHTGSGVELLILWAIGGGLTLAGVLCYAELGARRPQAGGIYVYLREAFGLMPAFLFGWTMALINYPGSVAAVATMFAEYLCSATFFRSSKAQQLIVATEWSEPITFCSLQRARFMCQSRRT